MLTRYQVVDSTAGNSDLAQHSLRVCGVPATTRTLLVSRLEELHCSVHSRALINVCWPVATWDPAASLGPRPLSVGTQSAVVKPSRRCPRLQCGLPRQGPIG